MNFGCGFMKIKNVLKDMATITTKQCSCKWVLQHQHKLKQAARACHLKVKEFLGVDEYRQYETDPQETFRYSDLTTKLAEPDQLRYKPDIRRMAKTCNYTLRKYIFTSRSQSSSLCY